MEPFKPPQTREALMRETRQLLLLVFGGTLLLAIVVYLTTL